MNEGQRGACITQLDFNARVDHSSVKKLTQEVSSKIFQILKLDQRDQSHVAPLPMSPDDYSLSLSAMLLPSLRALTSGDRRAHVESGQHFEGHL